MIDYHDLKEKGANDKQLSKLKELWPKLEKSKYSEWRPSCFRSLVMIYFDGGYILINSGGIPHIFCDQEFIRKKIVKIILGD